MDIFEFSTDSRFSLRPKGTILEPEDIFPREGTGQQTEGAVVMMTKMKKGVLPILSMALLTAMSPQALLADVGGNGRQDVQATGNAWSALAGSTLRKTLEGWASASGWTVVWDSPYDYRIQASATFRDDFQNSVARLIDSIHQSNPDINAVLYRGNRVLHVTSDALTSD